MEPNSLKSIAKDFLEKAAIGKSREAFDLYASENFKHHNVFFKGDAESLILAIEESAKENPENKIIIKRALQDGDMVAVHSHVVQKAGDPGFALIHIFKFENSKVVELWDFGQPVPAVMNNENGMF